MAASDWWPQIRSEIGLHPLATLRFETNFGTLEFRRQLGGVSSTSRVYNLWDANRNLFF